MKLELNNAQTQVVLLDAELLDHKKRVEILNTRIKILEEQRNNELHNKYFAQAPHIQESYRECPHPCNQKPHCHSPSQSLVQDASLISSIKVLQEQLTSLSKEVNDIKIYINLSSHTSSKSTPLPDAKDLVIDIDSHETADSDPEDKNETFSNDFFNVSIESSHNLSTCSFEFSDLDNSDYCPAKLASTVSLNSKVSTNLLQ